MSIQWTIIATFLYAEIAAVILLLLPFISTTRWSRIFKSRILCTLERQANIYFSVFILLLVLFFLDAIREMRKYTFEMEEAGKHDTHLSAELQTHMKLFRAQRNFYISGFALFLWLVLRRLVTLVSAQATLQAANAAAIKQAQGASEAAQRLLDEKNKKHPTGESADNEGNAVREIHENEVKQLKEKLQTTEEELRKARIDTEALKKQSESLTKEYDRLLKEHDKLQYQLERSSGQAGDTKKDD